MKRQVQRTSIWVPSGEERNRMNWETGMDAYTALCMKLMAKHRQLYSILYEDVNGEGTPKRGDACICLTTDLHCCTAETNSTVKQRHSNRKE